jgi:class 3 adenylate cyclase
MLLSEATAQLLPAFPLQALPAVTIRGRSRVEPLYALVGEPA